MDARNITYALEGAVAVIGLDRPAKRNALNDAIIAELHAAVLRAAAEARAGVIFGHGEHFSAGLDLAEHAERTPIENVHHSRGWHAIFDRIERGAIPFVAALAGAVIGGGMELAAATHVRVAEEGAFFALPEGQRGIFVGGGGSVRVARLISPARMADMMLTGRALSAAEAERANFVQYLAGAGAALAKAKELAARIAENPPVSNFAITNALPRMQDLSHDDGMFFEALVAALTQTTPEAMERMRAFLEKRAARLAMPNGETG
ncbi:MAG TPA: crotonase/enoyl-CoA hydratase family protein [Stellaceae bacterium]|nr:crotonase/enoyl-CoA hydratase family protein [Stellaceae bacterium]